MARSAALAAIPIRHGAGVHEFYFNLSQLILSFYWQYLKKALEFFSPASRHTAQLTDALIIVCLGSGGVK
jgi:hypothetical protein